MNYCGWMIRIFKEMIAVIWTTPLFFIYAIGAGMFSGWLKQKKQVKVAYTRKTFHFLIFSMAAVIQFNFGFPGVLLFGVLVAGYVLFACVRGSKLNFYLALARPGDAPHETFYIIVPLIATAVGGLLSNILFGQFAPVGYLVAGWGDAVAEPVGARWGRHRYRVLSLDKLPAERSLEGSAAVFIVGSFVACLGFLMMDVTLLPAVRMGLLCGLTGALVEAFSNHGLDNLTVQVAVSGVAWWVVG